MAELAAELLRTVARTFYPTEHILVIDALLIHHTLNDQDLAAVCGTITKPLRKTCGRLKEDGLLSIQQRAERRADGTGGYHGGFQQPGKERVTHRDWYYLNYHHAIDSIKFKLYRLNKHFESIGMPTTERKELSCPRCKSEYTMMQAIENQDFSTGNFLCLRCGHAMDEIDEDERALENESMKRLNQQTAKLTELMRKIDAASVPENDFQTALSNHKPILRADSNPGPKVEVVDLPNKNLQSTKGLEIKPEKIAVQVQDDEDVKREKAEAEAKERKEREAKQNALPEWISKSTVRQGEITAVGAKEEFERRQREVTGAFVKDEETEEKKPSVSNDDVMAEYWKALEREKEAERAREAEEDDDEEDEEEDEFEDVDVGGATPLNGRNGTAATSTGMNTPLNAESSNATDDERDSKRVRIEEPMSSAPVNGSNGSEKIAADTPAASDEDEDELEFENV